MTPVTRIPGEPYYQDEWVTIYHGEALAVLAGLTDRTIDAVLTDPPYSSGGMVRGDRVQDVHTKYVHPSVFSSNQLEGFGGDTRDAFGYWFWVSMWLGRLMQLVVPGGACGLFTDWRQIGVTIAGLQSGGWVYRGIVPWYKPSARPIKGRWANSCEYVVWGTNGPRDLDHLGPLALPGFFQANTPSVSERQHVTEKPLNVMRELVQIAPVGGTVLDPFAGTGTTLLAAKESGRRAIGIEIEERWCEIAATRCSQEVLGLETA